MTDKPMKNITFRMMSFIFRFRDMTFNPATWLEEAGITENMTILDYGCGPGTYTIAAAKMMNNTGSVFGLDIHPLAIKNVKQKAEKFNLKNISTIMPGENTSLPSQSVDIVLLYDVFHMFSNKEGILKEIHRILKPDGKLSFSDHHMKKSRIEDIFGDTNLFSIAEKNMYTITLVKK
ncbi:MAG: class I SAM-dependent methyltransferase [Bacteroidales bacterium]|nr:class I SAM-dependent methyltransferase [Bacteroidales bacterium]